MKITYLKVDLVESYIPDQCVHCKADLHAPQAMRVSTATIYNEGRAQLNAEPRVRNGIELDAPGKVNKSYVFSMNCNKCMAAIHPQEKYNSPLYNDEVKQLREILELDK